MLFALLRLLGPPAQKLTSHHWCYLSGHLSQFWLRQIGLNGSCLATAGMI
jgi:hypothetical protein